MEKMKFSLEQKGKIIRTIEMKTKNICDCDKPSVKVLDGHYYLPLLSAVHGNDSVTIINIFVITVEDWVHTQKTFLNCKKFNSC